MSIEQFIILIAGILTGSLSISVLIYCFRNYDDISLSPLGWFNIIGIGTVSIVLLSMFFGFIPMVEFK